VIATTPQAQRIFKKLIPAFMATVPWFAFHANAAVVTPPETVTISWDANPEAVSGYKLFVGTSSGVYTSVQTVTNGTSFLLAGLAPGATYFCAVQAFYADGSTSDLSAEISFSTRPDGDFGLWTYTSGISKFAALPSASPYGDGVPNLLKYAFNMNGSGPDVTSLDSGDGTRGLPAFWLNTTSGKPVFELYYVRRTGGKLVYAPKFTTNLKTYSAMTGTTTAYAIDSAWELVVVEMPVDPDAARQIFARVEVTLP
jgi:hypothetical protein